MNPTHTNLEKATRIYLGSDIGCRCGCRGNYAEKGTRTFDGRIKRAQEAMAAGAETSAGPNYLNISLPNDRVLCAYFD